jgi:two-component system, cell cycle response regulator
MSERVTKVLAARVAQAAAKDVCVVQIHGPDLGKKYVLTRAELTIGYEDTNDVVVDLDSVSRRHARITLRQGIAVLEDLASTNGTYLNGQQVVEPAALRSGDQLKVGGCVFKFLSGDNVESEYHETIYTMAIVDGLTGVYNKRFFLEFLEREMERCRRYERPLSLLLFDIDHFKKVNDTFGHIAGDYVLRELADVARRVVRREQCFARYGGEEFALVLPEGNLEEARTLAEKLRAMVQGTDFRFDGKSIPVTISIGVAVRGSTQAPLELVKAADERLYAAKRGGRNRVVSA